MTGETIRKDLILLERQGLLRRVHGGAVRVDYLSYEPAVETRTEFLAEKEEEYHETVANPYVAAQRGYIDDIIDPATTRARIIKALGILQNKRDTNPMKKHGNIPL